MPLSSSSSAAADITARLAALRNLSAPSLEREGEMLSSYAGGGTSSLQSGGGELDHPPSSARSSSTKSSGGGGVWNEEKRMCVVIDDKNLSSMCGAIIGTKGRFCTAAKELGQRHCGLTSHATHTHQAMQEGDIFPHTPSIRGKTTALSTPTIHVNDIPEEYMAAFTEPQTTGALVTLINNGLAARASRVGLASGGDAASEASSVSVTGIESIVDRIDVVSPKFVDDLSLEQPERQYPDDAVLTSEDFILPNLTVQLDTTDHADGESLSAAMVTQINAKFADIMVQVDTSFRQSSKFGTKLEEALWDGTIIPPAHPGVKARLTELVSANLMLGEVLGDVEAVAEEHGSIAGAISAVSNTAASASIISNQVDGVVQLLSGQVRAVDSSLRQVKTEIGVVKTDISILDSNLTAFKDDAVDTMTSLAGNMNNDLRTLKDRVVCLEIGGVSSSASSSTPVGMDDVIGNTTVDGTAQSVSFRSMFEEIQDLKRQLKASLSPVKSEGAVAWGTTQFNSEADYVLYFVNNNPTGSGLGGHVDLISIWVHGGQTTSDELGSWLTNVHKAQVTGFQLHQDTDYAMSFSSCYPKPIAGSDKIFGAEQVLPIFKSLIHWMGRGAGDGSKERLRALLALCCRRHADYCRSHLPPGPIRETALSTGLYVQRAVLKLINMFDDQIARLSALGLKEKFIMLLVSHEFIHVCDELYKIRQRGVNADLQNKASAAARFSFITLQALMKLDEFVSQGSSHPVFVAATQEFLMQIMASKGGAGASDVDLSELEAAIAQEGRDRRSECAEVERKLSNKQNAQGTKLDKVIRANRLKTTLPANNRRNNEDEE